MAASPLLLLLLLSLLPPSALAPSPIDRSPATLAALLPVTTASGKDAVPLWVGEPVEEAVARFAARCPDAAPPLVADELGRRLRDEKSAHFSRTVVMNKPADDLRRAACPPTGSKKLPAPLRFAVPYDDARAEARAPRLILSRPFRVRTRPSARSDEGAWCGGGPDGVSTYL